eukprot:COSAG05_NODE_1067_length_5971_cov_450.254257_11_plen_81_part_00
MYTHTKREREREREREHVPSMAELRSISPSSLVSAPTRLSRSFAAVQVVSNRYRSRCTLSDSFRSATSKDTKQTIVWFFK